MLSTNCTSPTQSNEARTHENQPMKRSRDIYEIFKKNSKLPTENIETLSQRKKMEETFSPSHDMAKDVGNGGKLLGEQDSLWRHGQLLEKVDWYSYLEMPIK